MKKIQLSNNKGFALVSDEDFERVNQFKWIRNKYGYAARTTYTDGVKGYMNMHRFIMGTPQGMDTNHINTDRLDNRRSNYRVCTRSQNVFWAKRKREFPRGVSRFMGRYSARITKNHVTKFLGYYSTPEEAHQVYLNAAENWS